MASGDGKLTPAMQQFHRFKQQHPGCVLFFRMGDFYEMFFEDAKLAHKVLGVTLTQRTEGVPMAGVPYHAVEGYLRRMIQAGHRVAVCDQVEDPAQAKGVVKRDVTRVITPGTLTDETLLSDEQTNIVAAVAFGRGGQGSGIRDPGSGGEASSGPDPGSPNPEPCIALAWAELSTGIFHTATVAPATVRDELARISPSEVLYCELATGEMPPQVRELDRALDAVFSGRPAWQFRQGEAVEALRRHFEVASLEGFGYGDDDPALAAAGAVLAYLLETQCAGSERGAPARLAHLQPPRPFQTADHLVVDQASLRALEVERTQRSGETAGSLLGTLQDCATAMGKRLLRQWLCYPLRDRAAIEQRQRVVGALVGDERFERELSEALDQVHDIPRMIGRLGVNRAAPRDLVGLGRSVQQVRRVAELLADRPSVAGHHQRVADLVEPLEQFAHAIATACIDDAPAHLRDGGLIRDGYDAQLDEYRALQQDSNTWLAGYQKDLIAQTDIPSLKVGYNKVFGYYIELTAAQRDKAPDNWTRKQTLKNAERFITPELKEYEGKVLSAQSRAIAREQDLFAELCAEAQLNTALLQRFADVVAELDVLASFARRAVRHQYVQPELVDEPVLDIEGGRHPVLDELLGDQFVPNDVQLGAGRQGPSGQVAQGSSEKKSATSDALDHSTPGPLDHSRASLALITGPNMAGKSTYIRQTALIALLAHTGSFVPADTARIGIVDRIFTRIGASDELHQGQSTFMVEMTETANICHHATERSLVILDEIGRGTSTLDGLSLAWAIAEHLAARRCRCLFATHYHELTRLAEQYEQVTNLNVTVREWQDQVVFLHRIVPGATDRSYGIHVAKIAGLPRGVVDRAGELLGQLAVSHEQTAPAPVPTPRHNGRRREPAQMSLFCEYLDHPAIQRLRDLSMDAMTPLQAFDLLRELHGQARDATPADAAEADSAQ